MTQPQVSVGIPAYSSPAFVEGPPIAAISARRGMIHLVVSAGTCPAPREKMSRPPAQEHLFVPQERGARL